jgi:outer membrane protein OmpA-like peptidoglycan-associated protein
MSLYAYEDDYDERRPTARIILCVGGAAVLAALLWFVIRPSLGGGGTTSAGNFDSAATLVDDEHVDATSTSVTSTTTVAADTTTAATTATTNAATTAAARAQTTTADAAVTTTTIPTVAPPPTPSTDASTDSSLPPVEEQTPLEQAASYPTLPDGTPTPILAIFDTDTITLSGTVPSQAAADRLAQLAIANSKTPAALVQFLAIDPDVPTNVGVRVLEMTSSRFPAGSSDILSDHGREIDRIGAVMEALPNTTVLVIGHADQRGSDEDNFAVSEARARAAVSHLVGYGIDASRLSSRAVGESDLISLNDDETALELNRRTEFVIYGTLLGT